MTRLFSCKLQLTAGEINGWSDEGEEIMRAICSGLILCASMSFTAVAQEKAVPAAELRKLITGKQVGPMFYGKDGRYTFNGGSPGAYKVSNGQICVQFDNGNSRCDRIVKEGAEYTLINSGGQRFPFRP